MSIQSDITFENFSDGRGIYDTILSHLSLPDLARVADVSRQCRHHVRLYDVPARLERICEFAQSILEDSLTFQVEDHHRAEVETHLRQYLPLRSQVPAVYYRLEGFKQKYAHLAYGGEDRFSVNRDLLFILDKKIKDERIFDSIAVFSRLLFSFRKLWNQLDLAVRDNNMEHVNTLLGSGNTLLGSGELVEESVVSESVTCISRLIMKLTISEDSAAYERFEREEFDRLEQLLQHQISELGEVAVENLAKTLKESFEQIFPLYYVVQKAHNLVIQKGSRNELSSLKKLCMVSNPIATPSTVHAPTDSLVYVLGRELLDPLTNTLPRKPMTLFPCGHVVDSLAFDPTKSCFLDRTPMKNMTPALEVASIVATIQSAPADALSICGEGRALMSEGKYKEAMSSFVRALSFDPKCSQALIYLDFCLDQLNNAAASDEAQGDATAQFTIGRMFEKGETSIRSLKTAQEWYQKAAAQGNGDAEYRLGKMHLKGLGVPESQELAEQYLRKAALKGHAKAMLFIAEDLESKGDYENAKKLYTTVADRGNKEAAYRVGAFFEKGLGGVRSIPQAVEYYSKAASLGHALAAYSLGEIFEIGRDGIASCDTTALDWYQKAAFLGHKRARGKADQMIAENRGVRNQEDKRGNAPNESCNLL